MRLKRLFSPASVAVIGGGTWCASVVEQCRKIGFEGPVWPVHPGREAVGGVKAYRSLSALPGAPDAAFIGVNRAATVGIAGELSAMGAGGAVCFASGFREAQAEDAGSADLEAALLEAAGAMPLLGPNCYGFVNYLDGAALWPDQHGGEHESRGVAVIAQSSNIAINLSMQTRGLPLAYLVTVGNGAQTGLAEIGRELLADPRVTALGLHIEGIGELRAFEALAKASDKPVIALKVGRSEAARAATLSHTASLAGSDAGANALLARLGIGTVKSLPGFIEALKLVHTLGPLPSARVASLSCSGGEACLVADAAQGTGVRFPPLGETQKTGLAEALGPMVALANPLDYHTYVWGDVERMARAYAAAADPALGLTMVILDLPRADRCDPAAWDCALAAIRQAHAETGRRFAIVSSLPEALPEAVARALAEDGIAALSGLEPALEAVAAAAATRPGAAPEPVLSAPVPCTTRTLDEAEAKAALAAAGIDCPRLARASSPHEAVETASEIGFPVALKLTGLAHKTEAGGVALGLADAAAVAQAAEAMGAGPFLVEEMIADGVVELLVGVTHDDAHGFVLTLGAGGVLAELMQDTVSLMVPAARAEVDAALSRLRIAPLIEGYRGRTAANRGAILDAVAALQALVAARAGTLAEIEINPLICGPARAVAADALIVEGPAP